MKKSLLTISLFGLLLSASAQTDSVVFSFTGAAQTFTVPACVSNVTIKAFGAQGANGGGVGGGIGANGALVQGDLAVLAGQTLTVMVGGAGIGTVAGFNGGGAGGNAGANGQGGGGGGATVVSNAGGDLIIAGGGGGGGGIGCETSVAGGNGGAGGGENGANGIDAPTTNGVAGAGFGALGSAGGLAGIGCGGFLGAPGTAGSAMLGGNGGAGQTCCCFTTHTDPSGGGGGGGLVGGGGGGAGSAGTAGCSGNDKGAGGGGAGGTNFINASLTATSSVNGAKAGDGQVVIVFTPTTLTMNPNPAAICDNASSLLLVDGTPSGGTWTGTGLTGNVLDPDAANIGNNTYTYTFTGNGCSLTGTAVINVIGCSKIDEAEALKFSLFPNPVNDLFTIQADASSKIETIQVIDATGKTVFSSTPNGAQSVQVDTHTWASGIYSVKINNAVKTLIKN